MKITYRKATAILEALSKLQGKFGEKTTHSLSKNIRRTRAACGNIKDEYIKLINKHGKDGVIEKNSPEYQIFNVDMNKFMDSEMEIEIFKIALSDLNVEENRIAPIVIADLEDVLIEPA